MNQELFNPQSSSVTSSRILYTPSTFARTSLLHLQEVGSLQAIHQHTSTRTDLVSFLCFVVLSGKGSLKYEGEDYELEAGDCVFIDCRKAYSHSTSDNLWSLQWCHFYAPSLPAVYEKYKERGGRPVFHPDDLTPFTSLLTDIYDLASSSDYIRDIYRKYQERGGKPVFRTSQLNSYHDILDELYNIASSPDYVRDMRIHEKLSSLLILLMEDAWDDTQMQAMPDTLDIQAIKDYLDENFKSRISLDDLAGSFYLNKYYLMKLFKDRYGMTINAYLNQTRVTWVKQQLRFTDKTVETLAAELQIESAYLSRLFKKVEGVSPTSFRKSWRGR